MRNTITVYAPGHYDMFDSYGLIACQLARHLSALGVYVNALGMGKTVMDSQPPDVRAITGQPIRAALGGIFLGYPVGYHRHANPLAHMGPRIAITMFESSRIPADWVEPLNGMDAVIVPSWFCANVFAECGVTAPIHVVPLGVGEVYQYAPRKGVDEGGRKGVDEGVDRPLTFLAFLDRGARKGGIVATRAFGMAFGEDMNYKLLLKARTRKNKDVTVTAVEPNIEIIDRDMTEQELYELYLRCDVLVNPHKGEGFGLLPREFAATGGIALATDWSGTADGIDAWGWPLPYSLERADWTGNKHLEGQELGMWAKVEPERVATKLQIIASNIDYYRAVAARKALAVPQMYSWRAFAEQVLSIWEEVTIGDRATVAAA